MRYLCIIMLIAISACNNKHNTDSYAYSADDSAYIKEHLRTITTPYYREVSFKVYNGYYKIYYTSDGKTRSYPDSFTIANKYPRNYSIQDENKDYILLTGSCGNPCHISYLLPLNNNNALSIADVIFTDLSNNCIVSVAGQDSLQIYNTDTKKPFITRTDECNSAYTGYCIDSLYITGDTLHIKFNNDGYKSDHVVKLN
ncbi:MAG TPA: hypothetical protein VK167_14795 [Flavipsychrobacter sp.]|nr:hypothetical protein [Flavipsychrobacter sp.]